MVRLKKLLACCFALLDAPGGWAQDLTPRAYLVTPTGSNAVILSYSRLDGSVFTDPTLPIEDFRVRYSAQVLSYYRSFDFFGRSASVTGSIPYAIGNFKAVVSGAPTERYRSGLADARIRLSVNLKGGPAMHLRQYLGWREKTVLGASLTVVTPTGQYDPAVLINPGLHRWALKPEIGLSRRWFNRLALDSYGGAWFFTPNGRFYPSSSTRTQRPIGALELHLSYYVTPRFWAALDGNFWAGGQTIVNGKQNSDFQRNSRIGATAAINLKQHHTLKVSYNKGAYISIGGDYTSLSLGWQYSWIDSPR